MCFFQAMLEVKLCLAGVAVVLMGMVTCFGNALSSIGLNS